MFQNTIRKIAIGYYDNDGYTYCLKHGRTGMEKLYHEIDPHTETCSVCGAYIEGDIYETSQCN